MTILSKEIAFKRHSTDVPALFMGFTEAVIHSVPPELGSCWSVINFHVFFFPYIIACNYVQRFTFFCYFS